MTSSFLTLAVIIADKHSNCELFGIMTAREYGAKLHASYTVEIGVGEEKATRRSGCEHRIERFFHTWLMVRSVKEQVVWRWCEANFQSTGARPHAHFLHEKKSLHTHRELKVNQTWNSHPALIHQIRHSARFTGNEISSHKKNRSGKFVQHRQCAIICDFTRFIGKSL